MPLGPLDNGLFVGPILGRSIVTSGGTCSHLRFLNPCKFHLLALAHTWLHLTVGLSRRQHGFKSRRGRHKVNNLRMVRSSTLFHVNSSLTKLNFESWLSGGTFQGSDIACLIALICGQPPSIAAAAGIPATLQFVFAQCLKSWKVKSFMPAAFRTLLKWYSSLSSSMA